MAHSGHRGDKSEEAGEARKAGPKVKQMSLVRAIRGMRLVHYGWRRTSSGFNYKRGDQLLHKYENPQSMGWMVGWLDWGGFEWRDWVLFANFYTSAEDTSVFYQYMSDWVIMCEYSRNILAYFVCIFSFQWKAWRLSRCVATALRANYQIFFDWMVVLINIFKKTI